MISIQNFAKTYNKKHIIKHSSFKIPQNQITFLMGENGAGKTTFIKCVTGLEKCEGDVTFTQGKDCFVVWDDTPFYQNLSGVDNLLILGDSKLTKKEVIHNCQKYVDNALLKRKVKHYSYGQKKKLSLALVALLRPKYLIMDEISNGLDFQFSKELKKIVLDLSKETTILLTGHQYDFYNDIIDNLLVFEDKKIVMLEKNFKSEKKKLETIYDSLY
ncbi:MULTISPECIES: ATP-binding cassette domain-containing protein [Brochothrix]|uniref:ABC transporter ATP-binding protein n=1 Tax=Brochothrix thermosphacta TaxID=2756 RepID=A0A1D2LSI6_BROTH|nr:MULTISPECIES: ATP-binding cassette domain-containing protein [Brochothrix]ATF26837.1 ABC transporter ATP-binding protein [Brochothrix thermosphacta]ATH86194.1 ABC transporter ATP-binding protein [Brochothrix thermosphacta]MBR5527161.1 ATP-binding cassette domain-containing protein [Brochothrix sp.]MPQ29820.1 ATP-binding cassette domain-containing protein [Brochothrix thermosphacta]ODJ48904.1 hypothetical protein BFR34_08540 [Brochothrix thermosphacta DSM 20171 = FSL F6-1036]